MPLRPEGSRERVAATLADDDHGLALAGLVELEAPIAAMLGKIGRLHVSAKICRVLAARMKKHGFKETKASIANKLARATVPAHFFLAALVAIGCEAVTLEDI
jgi:Domain of unknown function (DUF6471)